MECLFLLAGTNLLIIIFDFSVCSGLLRIVSCKSFVKQFVVNSFDVFLTIGDIQVRTLRVSVLCVKLSGVVIYRAASNPCTDRSFHSFTPFRRASGVPLLLSAKVTKALLTASGHQKRICALRGGVGALPPLSADSTPSRAAL